MARLGKFDRELLREIVYPRLGANRSEVLVGPSFGVDNAVIRIAEGKVIVVTTDPVSLIPALGPEDSAWLSAHNLASDLTTSGFPPAYAAVDFNLPPRMKDEEFSRYWSAFEREIGKLGAMIVGGHTGRFEGCDYTVIGGGTLIAIGGEEKYLSSNMARVGNSIIVTKSAGLSSAGILARVFPHRIEECLRSRSRREAQKLFRKISTVWEALTLASLGVREDGVCAMHDATEGGVYAALYELLTASRVGAIIEQELIPIASEVREICELFSLDPYTTLSEGCLIAALRPDRVDEAISSLKAIGIPCVEVGRIVEERRGIKLRTGTAARRLSYPKADPYWKAYWKGIKEGWK